MNPTRFSSFALGSLLTVALAGQVLPAAAQEQAASSSLDLRQYLSPRESEMLIVLRRYEADRDKLSSFYAMGGGGGGRRGGGGRSGVPTATQYARMKKFGNEWLASVQKVNDSKLSETAKGDKQKLIDEIKKDLAQLDTVITAQAEVSPAIPFASTIIGLEESRRKMQKPDAEKAAGTVHELSLQIAEAKKQMELGSSDLPGGIRVSKAVSKRAADEVTTLRGTLRSWNSFYSDYDPLFTWWMAAPFKEADKSLGEYIDYLRDKGGRDDVNTTITTPPDVAALPPGKYSDVPDLNELMAYPQSEMRGVVQFIQQNSGGGRGGGRRGGGGGGGGGGARVGHSPDEWLGALAKLDFDGMSRHAQVDYLLLKNRFENQKLLAAGSARDNMTEESAKFLPFETGLSELARKQEDKPNALEAVSALTAYKKQIEEAQKTASADLNGNDPAKVNRAAAGQAARTIAGLQASLKEWHDRNVGLDAKWEDVAGEPYKSVDAALENYAGVLRAQPGGAQRDGSDIVGRPIGREALMNLLQGEMIVYTPEELIARGEKEFAWCIAEMKKASRQMGFGDDWKKALEKVKDDHPPAGDQPYMIRDLMFEAIDYLRKNDLITVPVVDAETLQMEMMSPERQLVNPFFTGGALISVSYPTSTMSHDAKEQSMRGNNRHFARATVFHELIPGHNMQGFMSPRYSSYRGGFGTSFWGEGWACYWELLFYEKGFPQSPENKIGMLFWRLHRCARIVFSLKFHMGQWTPKQCIDYLVDGVGHERDNATAEVRRSFGTGYGPLYQAGYLLGALQLLELHKEIVGSGKMTERAFHDAIIEGGSMPIAMVRASLTKDKLTRDSNKGWRF